MIEAAVEGGGQATSILAVTVLTSFDDDSLREATGRPDVTASDEVARLAELAARARAHGIVCAGAEAATVRSRFAGALAILVPGIRMAGSAVHDQRRVVTPWEASAAGARYIVVGRAVTAAPDPREAMDQVLGELTSVAV
jgi:orotidine-5'-phosphate decarboxylase